MNEKRLLIKSCFYEFNRVIKTLNIHCMVSSLLIILIEYFRNKGNGAVGSMQSS